MQREKTANYFITLLLKKNLIFFYK